MAPIFRKFKTVWRHPVAIIALIIIAFITYNQLNARQEAAALKGMYNSDKSSVSFYDGKYHIDSVVIRNGLNKARMIASVEKQILDQKKTIQEVPDFIWRFLDSISYDKEFDIVNPGEDWKADITNYGHVVFKKVYDVNKKDSVPMISYDSVVLPNKQLVYFGMSENTVLFSYYSGGMGAVTNVIMMKIKNEKITDFWYGSVYEGNITTKGDIIKSLKTVRKGGC
jgi:hypothetical protein